MAKILLVEDDNNLREIYEARLQAEGYTIVSARDGEEALVIAKKEQPDLIISDVMMPRVSGFEMLDILRNTDGLKDVRVIMLTALGQAEDKTRADALGADRYLVKSQVTLEDIVRAAHELIGPTASTSDGSNTVATTPTEPQATATATPTPSVSTAPVTVIPVAAPTQTTPPPSEPMVSTPIPVSAPPAAATNTVISAPAVSATVVTSPPTPTTTVAASPVSADTPAPTPDATSAPTIPAPSEPGQAPQLATPSQTTISPTEPPVSVPTPIPATQAPEPQLVTTTVPVQAETESKAPEAPISNEEPAGAPVSPVEDSTPSSSTPAPSTQPSGVQSASEEEAAIKAQIERFVSQNDKTAPTSPKPAEDSTRAMMASAIKDLVSDANTAGSPEPSEPKVVQPPTPAAPIPQTHVSPEEAISPTNEAVTTTATVPDQQPAPVTFSPQAPQSLTQPAPDGAPTSTTQQFTSVPVAHKKVISPITAPGEAPPNLDELLAKEGITNLDDENESAPSTPPIAPSASQQQAFAAQQQAFTAGSPEPSEPHQPGHVISPSASSGVDPNSIAL